jgi:hypothetical protein
VLAVGLHATCLSLLLLAGCAGGGGSTGGTGLAAAPERSSELAAVGSVSMTRPPAGFSVPELAVTVFDQGIAAAEREDVFPTVRKAESLLLPVNLAATLRENAAFPLVRVVHSPDVFLPLVLSGEILHSDGSVLELELALTGADGQELFRRAYRDEAVAADYRGVDDDTSRAASVEPFADLYRAVANDLVRVLASLGEDELAELERLALIRFGAALSPASFSRYLETGSGDSFALTGFPAADDPMLARLDRLRRQDELFIDTVDQQYRDLERSVGESYDLLRAYGFELENYGERYRENAAERRIDARRGSFAAMQQVYATYRKVKLQQEDLRDLVQGFGGESLETVLSVDDGVYRLSGSVEERYAQWRRILGEIYRLETGLPAVR